MKKALILGTNETQADIIHYLREEGWEVHACGYRREGSGCDAAHYFHLVDTIDVDAVEKLAADINADIVYSVSSDSNIRSATKVAESMNLPTLLSSEIIDLFHYKDKFRQYLNENNINTVKYKKVTSLEQLSGWDIYPCVIKPADSQGQRGVKLLHCEEGLEESVAEAIRNSSSSLAIIEEYLDGVEISTNMLVQNGKILINEFTERLVHGEEFFGVPKGHSIPLRNVNKDLQTESEKLVENLVDKLKITNAILYVQMKVTPNGPKIIEVAPRLDGCHIWRLLKFAKGYDLRKYNIDCLLGKKINVERRNDNENYTLYFHQQKTGEKFTEEGINLSDNTVFNDYRYSKEEIIRPINGSLEVVGYCVKNE
ncbi:ATP-grasp domain-containing protein [Marinifilum fragile]|uniref:ATP-grasp domain-containing protein n=1 Tax=Marinifilum fragile TaxID=570161 RepID=UPI002AA79363|nr:ATP-grasp domain-containing protein [Marinifilum fragile]